MVLNHIFVAFFLVSLIVALVRFIVFGDVSVFDEMVQASFSQSKNAFEIALALTGVLALWLGLMKIAERSGLIGKLAQVSSPILSRLFPSVPKDHPALGNIFMNISANLLGLDNAATPLGIRSMESLQTINQQKDKASDAMIMFLAINASGLTLIPSSIMAYRLQAGAANPADIFVPVLIATFASTLVAILAVGIKQRIDFFQKPLLLFLLSSLLFIGGVIYAGCTLPPETFSSISTAFASILLFGIMCGFVVSGLRARINVYNAFIEGAKDGFGTAVTIIPYLLAMLVGIGIFRASGAMDLITEGLRKLIDFFGGDMKFVEGIPTMLMKPLSGSGARGLMVDAMQTYGADSFVGRLCSIVQGSSDTTFYVVALYYGAVKIRNTRYTVSYSLLADLAGALTAIAVTYIFFG